MSTKIYFVRHADVDNPENLLYGRLPGFPLSRLGHVQTGEITDIFTAEKIAAVFSSPQLRCRQTARPIAQAHHLPVRISRLIQEVGSSFDGISKAEF
ncbi:MAG: histidine phosphatase family protein, partial [Patescibacteria group bacterium]